MAAAHVLVTGSSGFLGRAIAARLAAAGHGVLGLDPVSPPAGIEARHVSDDLSDLSRLRDLIAAERTTHIVHAGGVSGPMVMADRADLIMAINVSGSLNLLQAALDGGVKSFVFCSSISAIGDYYEKQPIGEDYPMRPATPYGCSKAAVELVLRGLWRRVPLDLCSLRFTGIYGPGRRTEFVIDELVAAGLAGRPARVPAATDWPFVYIDDAAEATVGACFSERRRQLIYFVAYPEQVALAELTREVAAAVGVERLAVEESGASAARGPVDIEPAARDFGFAPRFDHREGIRRLVAARRAGRG
ncbi:MAG: NAD-dependent epimerase/dehydratase family protein [Pseudomonadota bacterium]